MVLPCAWKKNDLSEFLGAPVISKQGLHPATCEGPSTSEAQEMAGGAPGGTTPEKGGGASRLGGDEAPSKSSGSQGGGDGGNGNEQAQGGVQETLLSARNQERMEQVALEWQAEATGRVQSCFGIAVSETVRFEAGLLVSAHLTAKGNLRLELERGHFQVGASENISVQVQAVDIVVTADKPYMGTLTIPALENNAETQPLEGELAGLTSMSGHPVMLKEQGTLRSATLSIRSSLRAAILTERLSDLSIVHLDTPPAPRNLAIDCPKPLLNDMSFRVSVRMRALVSKQLLDSQPYVKKMTRINEGYSKECLLEAAKLTVHVNQGSAPEGAPQSAAFDVLLPTSK